MIFLILSLLLLLYCYHTVFTVYPVPYLGKIVFFFLGGGGGANEVQVWPNTMPPIMVGRRRKF